MRLRPRLELLFGLCLASAFASGCSEPAGPPRQETFPVTGEVVIDGKPVTGVTVELHDATKLEGAAAPVAMAYTDDQGKFEIATYQSGDGAPEGDYVVTFAWTEMQLLQKDAPPDKLKDKYRDPKKTTFKVKVEKGKPANLGKVELTTS